jgi:hypothetical protein
VSTIAQVMPIEETRRQEAEAAAYHARADARLAFDIPGAAIAPIPMDSDEEIVVEAWPAEETEAAAGAAPATPPAAVVPAPPVTSSTRLADGTDCIST